MEHNVPHRLVCDKARKNIHTFHNIFGCLPAVRPYSSPGDVPGAEMVMLAALVSMPAPTKSILGSEVPPGTLGVHQGLLTSRPLSIKLENDLIKMLKEGAGMKGLTSGRHVLVLVGDTVLIATSGENMIKKD